MDIIKESITPIYSADFLEYARTGVLEIKPLVVPRGFDEKDRINPKRRMYIAKTVTKDGLFSGNKKFTWKMVLLMEANLHSSHETIYLLYLKGQGVKTIKMMKQIPLSCV